MALDEPTKQKLIDLAVDSLRKDGIVDSEAQLDSSGFCCVTVRAYSTGVSVYMKLNMSAQVAYQLGLDTA